MTKLELMICEAENAGEIDLDTRDMMLSVLTEGQGTAQYRAAQRLEKEILALKDRHTEMENLRRKFDKEGNKRMVKAIDEKIKKNEQKHNELIDRIRETDPNGLAREVKSIGSWIASGQSGDDMVHDMDYGKRRKQQNPWRGNSGRNDREPGRYKTTSGLKESVLEEIYEAELCGDITPEERMALIDYMDD